jgi:hypothetical protein
MTRVTRSAVRPFILVEKQVFYCATNFRDFKA